MVVLVDQLRIISWLQTQMLHQLPDIPQISNAELPQDVYVFLISLLPFSMLLMYLLMPHSRNLAVGYNCQVKLINNETNLYVKIS